MPAVSPAWDTASAINTPNAATALCFTCIGEWYTEDARKTDPDTMPRLRPALRRFSLPELQQCWKTPRLRRPPRHPLALRLPAWLKPGSLAICCLKTYPACLIMTAAGRLRRSSMRWTDWGMLWNGRCLTAKILASLNPAAAYTLSDFLTPDVPERYYLSPQQQQRLLPGRLEDGFPVRRPPAKGTSWPTPGQAQPLAWIIGPQPAAAGSAWHRPYPDDLTRPGCALLRGHERESRLHQSGPMPDRQAKRRHPQSQAGGLRRAVR